MWNDLPYDEKEYIAVPKELAKLLEDVSEPEKLLEKEIIKQHEDQLRNAELNYESLPETVVRHRAEMIKFKNDWVKESEKTLDSLYEAWEKFDQQLADRIKETEKVLVQTFEERLKALQEVERMLDKANNRLYSLERFVELAERLEQVDLEVILRVANSLKNEENQDED